MTTTLADARAETARAFFQRARTELVAAMAHDPDLAVLEIGCGAGATGALALAKGKCGSWVGLELDPRLASEALYALTDVISSDPAAEPMPYTPASFGLVIVNAALGAYAKPWKTLAAVAPLLRHGGRFVVSVAARASLKGEARRAGFTPRSLRKCLQRAKIEPLSIVAAGGERSFLGRRPERIEAIGRRRG